MLKDVLGVEVDIECNPLDFPDLASLTLFVKRLVVLVVFADGLERFEFFRLESRRSDNLNGNLLFFWFFQIPVEFRIKPVSRFFGQYHQSPPLEPEEAWVSFTL